MAKLIKMVPVPLSGVMLGTLALGNLLQSYSEGVRYALGIIAFIFLVMIVLKLIMYPGMIKEDMNNPVMASVAATFPMSIMLLSVYAKPFIGQAAFYIWILGIVLHCALIIWFTFKFILKFNISKVFASYYIVYVGIVVASLTAPAYEMKPIGVWAFWFGFVTFVALLFVVTYRYATKREIPDPAKPVICIYAAPMSLCIAGYISSVDNKNIPFLIGMYVVATIIYVFALLKAAQYIRLPFFPSFASFTFPFVISAIASKQLMAVMAAIGSPMIWIKYVVIIQTIIAVFFVLFTIGSYLRFFVNGLYTKESKQLV